MGVLRVVDFLDVFFRVDFFVVVPAVAPDDERAEWRARCRVVFFAAASADVLNASAAMAMAAAATTFLNVVRIIRRDLQATATIHDMNSTVETAICDAIDARCGEMRDTLASLVAIASENPPGRQYAECVHALTALAERLGLRPERIVIDAPSGERTALRIRRDGGGPALCFHGHYDVVPAQSPELFTPRVEGDTMFGRGTSDMKSGLVSMLYAAHVLRAHGADRGLELLLVPDEETGGRFGSASLAARGELGRNVAGMLLPEPTSGVVWNASRGALTIEVTVKGRTAHVGLAQHGVNAVERALPVLNALFDKARQLAGRRSVLLVGGRVDAGTNFNAVPSHCRFTIASRIDPDENFERLKRELIDVLELAKGRGTELEFSVLQEGDPSRASADTPLARTLRQSVLDVTGEAPAFELCPGLLETRFYSSRGIPAYAYGPGILAVSHGPTEFVRIGRMVECAKIYALTALRTLGGAA